MRAFVERRSAAATTTTAVVLTAMTVERSASCSRLQEAHSGGACSGAVGDCVVCSLCALLQSVCFRGRGAKRKSTANLRDRGRERHCAPQKTI